MGAHFWAYWVPYRKDVAAALEDLRQQEFAAGRYYRENGQTFTTIDATLANSADVGTRSILDMIGVADTPRNPDWHGESEYQLDFDSDPMFSLLAPLTSEQLVRLFGTDRPTHAMIEANYLLSNYLDRGLGLYIVVYDGATPDELFFAGYSFD